MLPRPRADGESSTLFTRAHCTGSQAGSPSWVSRIPPGRLYEPKCDGFRSIIFRDGDEVEIGSRNERPMTRYFPEIVAAVKENLPERCVVDGEIIVADEEGKGLDFNLLSQRIH